MIKAQRIGMPLGLHLNFSEGIPLSDPASIPSLLLSSAPIPQFRGKDGFIQAEKDGIIQVGDVEHELRAQVDTQKDLFCSWNVLLHSLDTFQTTWTDTNMSMSIRVLLSASPLFWKSMVSPKRGFPPRTWTKWDG